MRKKLKIVKKINDEVELIVTHLKPPFFFSGEAVHKTAFSLLKKHEKAINLITKGFSLKPKTYTEIQECFHGFFGKLDEQHGIYPKNRLGFIATEPQITKGIVDFINPSKYGEKGESRLKTFLLALLHGQEKYVTLVNSLESGAHSFVVEAEKFVPKDKRRIDIFVAWNPQEKGKYEYGLIIEAKFGHKVTTGQLPTYRNYAQNLIKNDFALVLLTLDGEQSTRNKSWHPVQWFTLMSRWERELDDNNMNFNYFKRFIWNKI